MAAPVARIEHTLHLGHETHGWDRRTVSPTCCLSALLPLRLASRGAGRPRWVAVGGRPTDVARALSAAPALVM